MYDRKAGIGDRGSRFDRFRVAIKRNEARIRGDAVKNGTTPPVPTSQILYNQAIIDHIVKSAELGHEVEVKIPEI